MRMEKPGAKERFIPTMSNCWHSFSWGVLLLFISGSCSESAQKNPAGESGRNDYPTIGATIKEFTDFSSLYGEFPKETRDSMLGANPQLLEPYRKYWEYEKIKDYFHPAHLNTDGKLDFIYSGASGAEGNILRFFLNQGDTLKEMNHVWGTVNSWTIRDQSIFQALIWNKPCCGDFVYRAHSIMGACYEDSVGISYLKYLLMHEATQLPEVFLETPILFEVENDPYHLRLTPAIDSSTYYFPMDTNTNVYHSYHSGDKGMALAETTDRTGRVWWYVEMAPVDHFTQKDSDNSDNQNLPYLRGWMSSRFLKRL